MATIMAFKEPSGDYMAYDNMIWTFPGYELSFGTLLARVGWLRGGEQHRETNTLTETPSRRHPHTDTLTLSQTS